MKRFDDYRQVQAIDSNPRVVTIGNFDGVHLGHTAVLKRAKREADRLALDLAVLTFEPHPAELLKPDGPKLRLVEPEKKLALLEKNGVDLVLAQRFDQKFSEIDAQCFVSDVLSAALHAKLVTVGHNFRFGKERSGNIETLAGCGEKYGFQLHVEHIINRGDEAISSSRIRRLLAAGDTRGAGALLGRPHEVAGNVAPDRGRGTGLGFPTVNLVDVRVVVPSFGIYAATCEVGDDTFGCAVYIGNRPTLSHGFAVEAHLLDFEGDLYGQRVVLRFLDKVRDEQKFDGKTSLVAQMSKDIEKIRAILEKNRD
jgi:riboflavin kinase/FMN adenylyltransferase